MELPLQTERLVLRRFTADDLEAFQAYRSDPVLARYQGWQPEPNARARAFLTEQSNRAWGTAGQWLQVAITRRDTGAVIGDLGLCLIDERARTVQLGFTLARWAQGRGYTTEAVSATVAALLAQPGVRMVRAITDTRNVRSVALLRRVGFTLKRTVPAMFRGEACREHTFVYEGTRRSKRTKATGEVESHFANRAPEVRAAYDRIVRAAQSLGPVTERAGKTSIRLVRRTAFAGVRTRRAWLVLTIASDADIRSPRITRRRQVSAQRWNVETRVEGPKQVDQQLTRWLRRAYKLAE